MKRSIVVSIVFWMVFSTAAFVGISSEAMAEDIVLPDVVFYEDELLSYCYTYQSPDLYDLDIVDKKVGPASLKVGWDVPAGNWPGAGIGLGNPMDFTPYKENGVLTLWIKSETGGEKIDIGFVDEDGFLTRRPLALYIGALTTEWQKVEIPLKNFSDKATRWDNDIGKNVRGDFKWDAVQEFALVFGRADGDEHWIKIDDVKITMSK